MWFFILGSALAAEVFEGQRFVFGDIHAHTGASGDGGSSDMGSCVRSSDGEPADCGSVAEIGTLARAAGIDFMATVDHVTSMTGTTTDSAFEEVFQLVNDLNDPVGDFVTLPGAEIFVELPEGIELGHRSLIMFGQPAVLEAVRMVDLQPSGSRSNTIANCAALSSFMVDLQEQFGPVLLIPHHPGVDKPMSTDWSCSDGLWAPVVEAYSEHGSSFDVDSDFDPPWSGWAPEGSVLAALHPDRFGLRLGLVGGTDNHDTHPGDVCRTETVLDNHPYSGGLTGVVLEDGDSFGRPALYTAFRERRTYSTTGPQLPVIFEVVGDGGVAQASMGEILSVAEDETINLELRVPDIYAAMIDSVTLMGPDRSWEMEPGVAGLWRIKIEPDERPHYVLADVQISGDVWFDEPCVDGGSSDDEHIWTSPIWIQAVGSVDADADGFTAEEGDCDDTNPFMNPAAAEACRTPGADYDCDGIPSESDPDCAVDTAEPEPPDSGEPTTTDQAVELGPAEGRERKSTCSTVAHPASRSIAWWGCFLLAAWRRRA